MIIRTIAADMDNCRIFISDKLWYSPKYAIRSGAFQYVGQLGWYPDAKHKELFELLESKYKISDFYPGEYIEVELKVDYEQTN